MSCKLQFVILKLFLIITIQANSSHPQPLSNLDKLNKFILKQISLHTKPTTFWVLNEEVHSTKSPADLTGNITGLPVLQQFPVIRGKQQKTFRQKHPHLVSFIFLIVLSECSLQHQTKNLNDEINTLGNKRKDTYIFIGLSEDCLRKIFKYNNVAGLRKKYGFDLSTGELWVEPASYEPSGWMKKLTDPSQWKPNPTRGNKFNGRHLRVTGTLLPHWLYRISDDESAPLDKQYDGTNFRMFMEAAKRYNFTFELYAPPGQSYGELLDNGTWLGQVGDVVKTKNPYDCAILLGHVEAWYPLLDFAGDLDFAKLEFLTSHPQRYINWEAVLAPFQTHVWILILLFYFAIVLTSLVILKFGSKKFISFQESLSIAAEMSYRLALEQNARVPHSTRHISALWMISIIIIGTCYKCNLASYLSSPTIISVPSTYRELSERKDYNIILTVLGVAEKKFFDETQSPVFKNIKDRKTDESNPYKCLEQAFFKPKTVCIGWSPLSMSFAQESLTLNPRIEPLVVSSEPALPVSMSVAFQKDSVFVDGFTPITHTIYESGIYHNWAEEVSYVHKLRGKAKLLQEKEGLKYLTAKKLEEAFGSDGVVPFTVNNLKFPFIFLIVGLMVSLFVFWNEKE